jgi:hypothetical protein
MTQATQPPVQLKAVDFLDELPRRLLTDTDVDDNLYRELVKGKSWDRALSILCDVEACSMYPASTQPCQRWLRTLATVVAALARIEPSKVDDKYKESLGELAGALGVFLLTGEPAAFTDACAGLGNLRVVP